MIVSHVSLINNDNLSDYIMCLKHIINVYNLSCNIGGEDFNRQS